jgi:hypothetical protein
MGHDDRSVEQVAQRGSGKALAKGGELPLDEGGHRLLTEPDTRLRRHLG